MTNADNEPAPTKVSKLRRLRLPLIAVLLVNGLLIVGVPFSERLAPAEQPSEPETAAAEQATDVTRMMPLDRRADTAAGVRHGSAQRDRRSKDAATPRASTANPIAGAEMTGSLKLRPLLSDGMRTLGESLAFSAQQRAGANQWAIGQVVQLAKKIEPPVEPAHANVLTLANPGDTGIEVYYAVDGTILMLAPGQSKQFSGGQTRRIQFHRGGEFGEADYTLTSGAYEFRVSSTGWDLSANAIKH